MHILFSIDIHPYLSKPDRTEAARINNRIGQNTEAVELMQLPELITKVGEEGYTIAPGVFKDGKRSKDNFLQQQLFMLDFDNSDSRRGMITLDEFMNRCRSLDLPVTATYETFSSTKDNPRFRAIFLNDAPISDKRLATDMARMLGAIFPEADRCWKDYSRMYFGGKKVICVNDDLADTISIPSLIKAYEKSVYINDKSGKHCKEKLRRFWKNGKPQVVSCDAVEDVANANRCIKNGGDLPSPIILKTNIESGKIPPFYKVTYSETQQRTQTASTASSEQNIGKSSGTYRTPYRSDILLKLLSVCQLFDEFIHGKRALSHDELFGLATNLIQIEGGRKCFLDTCSKYPELHTNDDPESGWDRQLSYIREEEYLPERCDKFCPYEDVCWHIKNMLKTAAPEFMEKIDGYSLGLRSRDKVLKETERAIRNACNALDIRVYVINSMTAIGKTSIFINIIFECRDERFLIAEPTNMMKDECCSRLLSAGVDAMVTPSLDELEHELSEELWSKLKKKRSRGEETTSYIAKLIREEKCSKGDASVLKEFLRQKQELKKFKGAVVTTHRYLSMCDEKWLRKFDNIIVDEDILYKLVATNHDSVSMRKLKKIAKSTSSSALKGKVDQLRKALKQGLGYIKLDSVGCSDNDVSAAGAFDIKTFCEAEHFYVRSPKDEVNLKEETVSYVAPLNLPKDMKLIVVSATANEEVYEQYFGADRVKFKMRHRAPYKGTLQQYYGLSMSRSCLKSHLGIVPFLQKYFGIPDSNVITYLAMGIGEMHYGNCEGSNMLEGEDILVIGSAYQPPFIYVLAAAALGFEISDTEMHNQYVEHNGYRFKYYAFDDEELRTVQFWMTESELEQAVGRARLLWHDCTAYVASNFPVQQAQMIDGYTVYGSFIKGREQASTGEPSV